jgi:transcriptional regulator with XRE-family HTH domain
MHRRVSGEVSVSQTALQDWLRGALDKSGLSGNALAKKANVSQSTVSRILTGKAYVPNWLTVISLAVAAGVEPPPTPEVPLFAAPAALPPGSPSQPTVRRLMGLMGLTQAVTETHTTLAATAVAHPEVKGLGAALTQSTKAIELAWKMLKEEGIALADVEYPYELSDADKGLMGMERAETAPKEEDSGERDQPLVGEPPDSARGIKRGDADRHHAADQPRRRGRPRRAVS